MANVPDDWNSYYHKCTHCGNRYHASEYGCGCLDDKSKCRACGEWTENDDLDDENECPNCVENRCCSECETQKAISFYEDCDEWLCKPCDLVLTG